MWGESPLPVRRLVSLASGFPADSATARAADPHKGWTNNEELLALLAELLDTNNRLFIMANSKKDAKPPKPIAIPRPWHQAETVKPKKRAASGEELAALFSKYGGSVRYTGD